jgi:long-subunit fatty acid transport protein
MKNILWILWLLPMAAVPASAQTFDLISAQLYEPLIGSYNFTNARIVSMGGAATAIVNDGSALWYNPALLAQLEYTEISGDLDFNRFEGETLPLSLDPLAPPPTVTPTTETMTRTRLSAAYIAIPLQGYSRNWTVGLGMTVTNSLDRALKGDMDYASGTYRGEFFTPPDTFVALDVDRLYFTDDQRGVIRAWQLGIGGEVSPSVLVGATGAYYYGTMDLTTRTTYTGTGFTDTSFTTPTGPVRLDYTTSTTERMRGWGAHLGFLVHTGKTLGLGVVVRSPVTYTIDLDQIYTEQRDQGQADQYDYVSTRKLRLPLSVTGGLALILGHFKVAGDVSYTDWSQSEYRNSPWISQYNDLLRHAYQEQLAYGGGAEFKVPLTTMKLRAGVRRATLPYNDSLTVSDNMTYSAGVGFLFDGSMALDLAGSWSEWSGGNPLFGFDEKYTRYQIVLTTAYRF